MMNEFRAKLLAKEPIGIRVPNKARDGNTILPVYHRTETPSHMLQIKREQLREQFEKNKEVRFRRISGLYNCLGLVLTNRRYWVEPDAQHDFDALLKAEGYRQLQTIGEAMVGDVVLYRDLMGGEYTHIGVIVHEVQLTTENIEEGARTFEVLSKWGEDGEYIHKDSDVPSRYGVPREYWTDRTDHEPP